MILLGDSEGPDLTADQDFHCRIWSKTRFRMVRPK